MAKGANVQKHPSFEEITKMLTEGYTPDEVSKWLKQKYKHKMYWISGVTLTAYRNNFMSLTREQAVEKRRELLNIGDTQSANQLETFTAKQDYVTALKQQETEVVNAIQNFKSIQDKIMERINLIDTQTRDEEGNPVYKPRNEEILEKYLGRLESMTATFVKIQESMKKQQEKSGTTEIQITMAEIGKYTDAIKSIIQKILIKLDPSLLNEFLQIYTEEIEKINPPTTDTNVGGGNQVKISIKNTNNAPNINIITSEPLQNQEEPKTIIDTESTDITQD